MRASLGVSLITISCNMELQLHGNMYLKKRANQFGLKLRRNGKCSKSNMFVVKFISSDSGKLIAIGVFSNDRNLGK